MSRIYTLFILFSALVLAANNLPPNLGKTSTNFHALSNVEGSVLVCVSKTAKKYHSHQCSGLLKCTHKIETIRINEAMERGYTACKYCY
jgi:hypothetical protein